jgi:hypothetical protein
VVASLFFARKHVGFRFLAALMFPLSILGGALIFLTIEQNVRGAFRVFLVLVGIAPAAMIVSIILHNAISGLLTALLKREFEEAVFFLIALFACPAAFLVGTIGSIVLIIKNVIHS